MRTPSPSRRLRTNPCWPIVRRVRRPRPFGSWRRRLIMFNQNTDEGSVKGKGPAVMLPSRGNPFDPKTSTGEAGPQGAAALAALEPRDLSPDELAALFPTAHSDREAAPAAGAEAVVSIQPTDSSLEDLAALSPSSHEDRQPSATADEGIQPEPMTQPETAIQSEPVTQPATSQPPSDSGQTAPGVTIVAQPSQGGTVLNTVVAGGQDQTVPSPTIQVTGDLAIVSPTYKPGQ